MNNDNVKQKRPDLPRPKLPKNYVMSRQLKTMCAMMNLDGVERKLLASAECFADVKRKTTSRKDVESIATSERKSSAPAPAAK